eukprot:CAMPEP_0173155802 /NCGR_PEP_ID=MMETSP1105-20130129/14345_1 /TAXON_ID=2985 /ORGANISM="Ochromonas sp., Strain BG-1" /LENGTH=55 /DNA_ID=CAMNT_0014072343 /DNA_START=96 /DNA_END=263 /DNA_ORIENTATION=+
MAVSLSKEAVRGICFALCVAGSFKYFIDGGERANIIKYYKEPHPPSAVDEIKDHF